MKIEMKASEPIPDAAMVAASTADLASLKAELEGIDQEERERASKVDFERRARQAVTMVERAESYLTTLRRQLTRIDQALSALSKTAKAADLIPDGIMGRQQRLGISGPGVTAIPDIAEFLSDVIALTTDLSQANRGKVVAQITDAEQELARAQEFAASVRRR
jgi:hypothetical protein